MRRAHYLRNREAYLARGRANYLNNREAYLARAKRWKQNNPDKRKEILLRFADRHRTEERERARRRHKENPKRTLERLKKWQAKARKGNLQFILKTRLRGRIYAAMKRGYTAKSAKTIDLLGCSFDELRRHIEKQFTDGMSWDKISEIHLDHIMPCAMFDLSDPEQQRKCFHFSNLQPLWKMDNLRKSGFNLVR